MNKVELPLATDREIQELVDAFQQCSLDVVYWTHRAHLAVGVFYARRLSLTEALDTMRSGIQRYNAKNNNPTGYNETITRLFLAKMASDIQSGLACNSLADEVRRLTAICTVEWLYFYYSKSLIHSDSAKANWIEPDRHQIDFPVPATHW